MRSSRLFPLLALLGLLAALACSDNPTGPGTAGDAPAYDISLTYMDGPIEGVWGTSIDDVYAGGNLLLHFDGSEWTPLEFPREILTISTLWGDANGVLSLANSWRVYRLARGTWDYIALPGSGSSVVGLPSGEILNGGYYQGIIYRYDGSVWSPDSIPGADYTTYVSASSMSDAYATGYTVSRPPFIAHFDGVAWTPFTVDTLYSFYSVANAPDGGAFVVARSVRGMLSLMRYRPGIGLETIDRGGFVPSYLYGTGDDVYAGGRDTSGPRLDHYDGVAWQTYRVGSRDVPRPRWAAPTGEVFATDYVSGLWKSDASTSEEVLQGSQSMRIEALWTSPDGDLFAVGNQVLRYDDDHWIDVDKQSITTARGLAVDGLGSDDFYVVGSGMILHYAGGAWDWVSGGFQKYLRDVAVMNREVFAVGDGTAVVHFDGRSWGLMETPAVSGLRAIDTWDGGAVAVGVDGAIVRYDGTRWQADPPPVEWWLLDVVAFSERRMVAVGDNPWLVVVFDGKTWETQVVESYRSAGHGNSAHAVWGRSASDFYVAQRAGTIQHFDGQSWTELPHVLCRDVSAISGNENQDVFVATYDEIIRYRPR